MGEIHAREGSTVLGENKAYNKATQRDNADAAIEGSGVRRAGS